jgi:hypothetical protein
MRLGRRRTMGRWNEVGWRGAGWLEGMRLGGGDEVWYTEGGSVEGSSMSGEEEVGWREGVWEERRRRRRRFGGGDEVGSKGENCHRLKIFS